MAKIKIAPDRYALVTGASKGLGYAYCVELLKLGYNVIGVARDCSSLEALKEQYPNQKIENWNMDMSIIENNHNLFEKAKRFDVDLIINNAGYGVWGYFAESDLDQEMNMIDLNIKSLHILTKLFVQEFQKKGYGRVLNIGSMAAFTPAPVFASYYASKAYVWSLGVAINTELKKTKSKVRVITLCPGPLKTEFWNRSSNQKDAKYKSTVKVMKTSVYARKSLKAGIKSKKKNYIITGNSNKMVKSLTKWAPQSIVLNSVYNYQRKRK
ncbi:SDR family NAD(P)-dependent oxidoreductase [Spiroplasma culicicola]|uniref:Short-chain dehydrogenase/reductase SDR n=1 Tax=Spiroplasma culicicola AES-1 TaxID=1276246 RepID=W6A8L4_9MOLU|nr:SDR family NAD(P)-dependent oxidoreductase [Spiroplasma culicicola]AHI53225.1 short-chain dehydrogenase/reductase SDR [Spiroplasma culicicola AES-1]